MCEVNALNDAAYRTEISGDHAMRPTVQSARDGEICLDGVGQKTEEAMSRNGRCSDEQSGLGVVIVLRDVSSDRTESG